MDDITPDFGPASPDGASTPPPEPPAPAPWVTAAPAPLPPTPPKRPARHSPISTFAVALMSAALGAAAVVAILAALGLFKDSPRPDAGATSAATATTVVRDSTTRIVVDEAAAGYAEAVARKVLPSVVTVEVGELVDGDLSIVGSGSGVVIDNGYIITNHHVVSDTTVFRVVLQDGRIYDATLVGSDAYTDLAVLSVDAGHLPPIEFGSTENLVVGQPAIAVGNPLGQAGGASLTEGVISALSRTVQFGDDSALYGMLQTDAPITSGSSGGALVDVSGKLIGITSAIGVGRGGAEGIGYAIPVELVDRVTTEIIQTGTVHHTFIGIYGQDYTDTADDGALIPAGAKIAKLWEDGSPAGDAGFKAGDAIVDVDGTPIRTMEDLVVDLRLYRVGDEIEVTVMRDGKPITATVTLVERPPEPEPIIEEDPSDGG